MLALGVTAGLIAALALLWLALQRATRRRRGDALGPFLRHFEALGVPPQTARAAYGVLEGWLISPRAPSPSDDLARVYGVGPDERRETAALVARACGHTLPAEAAVEDVESVEDLVLFVARCPRQAGRE